MRWSSAAKVPRRRRRLSVGWPSRIPANGERESFSALVSSLSLHDSVGERLNPAYPSVYVGQSVHPPEERFAQHGAGYKASRYVRNHGRWLRPSLYRTQTR